MENNAKENLDVAKESAQEILESVRITVSGGDAIVKLRHFNAMDGWEINKKYREFLETKDSSERISFTIIVLSHATFFRNNDSEGIPLNSYDAINNNLQDWKNVETVFQAVLGYNGIKTNPVEVERRRWQVAGEDMAAHFIAAVSGLIGPALKVSAESKTEK